jgi:hypothetical protein
MKIQFVVWEYKCPLQNVNLNILFLSESLRFCLTTAHANGFRPALRMRRVVDIECVTPLAAFNFLLMLLTVKPRLARRLASFRMGEVVVLGRPALGLSLYLGLFLAPSVVQRRMTSLDTLLEYCFLK